MYIVPALVQLVVAIATGMFGALPESAVLIDASRAQVASVTTVYIVRHAEKATWDPNARDPVLSAAGTARSEALARALEDEPVAAAFATEYKRTQLTIAPTAKAHHVEITIAEARDPAALAARVTEQFRGRTVLIAGHSNTVPALLKALGVADPPTLAESDYDDLFVVTLSGEAAPTMLHLHYGAPDSTAAIRQQLADQAANLLDDFHDAAAKADEDRYFGCFARNGLFLGTDATERWTLDQFKAFALPYFQGDSAWVYTPVDRKVNVSDDLTCAWFDEQLKNDKYGLCRGSGVLQHIDGAWRIVQYHLTIPIPNDLARDIVERIRARASADN